MSESTLQHILEPLLSELSEVIREVKYPLRKKLLKEVIISQKEELAELIVALSHWERGKAEDIDVGEEIIDTLINSLLIIFFLKAPIKDLTKLQDKKLTKFWRRLGEKGFITNGLPESK